jgi:hypothetical protein
VDTIVSTPQADTECPSANTRYSSLRYKKKEKFAPYIPIAKARGFTAFSGKPCSLEETLTKIYLSPIMLLTAIKLTSRSLISNAQMAAFPGDFGAGLYHFKNQQEKATPISISQAAQ